MKIFLRRYRDRLAVIGLATPLLFIAVIAKGLPGIPFAIGEIKECWESTNSTWIYSY